jgi:hypothetical protein
MLDALIEKIEASSIRVFCDTSVDSLEIREEDAPAVCQAGETDYHAEEIITGQNMEIDISVNGKPFRLQKAMYGGPENLQEGYVHIVFMVDGAKKQPFTYIDLHNTSGLRRLQDVTTFSKFDPSTSEFNMLICCQVLKEAFDKLGGPTEIFSHLITVDLLKPGARIVDYHLDEYPPTGCITNEELSKLEKTLPGALRIMRTWDLGISLDYYYDCWLALVTP